MSLCVVAMFRDILQRAMMNPENNTTIVRDPFPMVLLRFIFLFFCDFLMPHLTGTTAHTVDYSIVLMFYSTGSQLCSGYPKESAGEKK